MLLGVSQAVAVQWMESSWRLQEDLGRLGTAPPKLPQGLSSPCGPLQLYLLHPGTLKSPKVELTSLLMLGCEADKHLICHHLL